MAPRRNRIVLNCKDRVIMCISLLCILKFGTKTPYKTADRLKKTAKCTWRTDSNAIERGKRVRKWRERECKASGVSDVYGRDFTEPGSSIRKGEIASRRSRSIATWCRGAASDSGRIKFRFLMNEKKPGSFKNRQH